MKIIVVDDDQNILNYYKVVLEKEGHLVEIYLDPQAALDHVAKDPCQLVILDVVMPKVDGKNFLFKLGKVNKSIPIFISTGLPKICDDPYFRLSGQVSGFILKPVDPKVLINMVKGIEQQMKKAVEEVPKEQ